MTRRALVASPASQVDSAPLRIASGTVEALKWLALLLMTIDHINKYLFGGAIGPMYAADRVAMPLFVFVLAYNAARPGFFGGGTAQRTCMRLALYGAAAIVPFVGLGTLLGGWWPLNIMFTLLVSVGVLWASQSKHRGAGWALVVLFAVGGGLVEYWWPALLLAVAAWRYALIPSTARLAVLALALTALTLINQNLWALAALPLIVAAPRVEISVPRVRTFFYAYYPAHLAALWLIVHLR
jgi:hypothetical protein